MHSSRMRTARSLTVSRRILCMPPPQPHMPSRDHAPPCNHAHPPQPCMHAPLQPCTSRQPCPPSNHACPLATIHPSGNHACPPQQPHMPPRQPRTPPGSLAVVRLPQIVPSGKVQPHVYLLTETSEKQPHQGHRSVSSTTRRTKR